MHTMKDPTDLDIFEGHQAILTQKADATGKEGLEIFISNILAACTAVMHVGLGQFPMSFWQRAAFEAHELNKREPSAFNKRKAELLWMHVRFFQEGRALSIAMRNDPELSKENDERGYPSFDEVFGRMGKEE